MIVLAIAALRAQFTEASVFHAPPSGERLQTVVLSLPVSFPARFGSFSYTMFSCDYYYVYTYVSVEGIDSRPLT